MYYAAFLVMLILFVRVVISLSFPRRRYVGFSHSDKKKCVSQKCVWWRRVALFPDLFKADNSLGKRDPHIGISFPRSYFLLVFDLSSWFKFAPAVSKVSARLKLSSKQISEMLSAYNAGHTIKLECLAVNTISFSSAVQVCSTAITHETYLRMSNVFSSNGRHSRPARLAEVSLPAWHGDHPCHPFFFILLKLCLIVSDEAPVNEMMSLQNGMNAKRQHIRTSCSALQERSDMPQAYTQ